MNMFLRRLALGLLLTCGTVVAHAQVSQNFNALPASGSATWTNDSTLPGWFHARTGTGTTIVANNGSSNAGNLYSYGTGTDADRALGSLGSGNAAIGNLFWGLRLQNDTGETITSLTVSYTGEQWRNSAAAAQTIAFSYLVGTPTVTGSLAEFQSPGIAVPALDFTSPVTGGAAGALDGNAAGNRTTVSFTITGLDIPAGTEVMLRWSDPDHTGADHGLSIDDVSVAINGGGGGEPVLSISDTNAAEGDSGTTPFFFSVSLDQPAGAGGVSFDYATADGTATAGTDYVARTSSATIAAGASSVTVNVDVNGDTGTEPNETFVVNVSNITGATAGDVQGVGTINNDDVTLTPIHDVQGNGQFSPLAGQGVTVEGIVTGRKSNGFFVQGTDAEADADPQTSEGIFVFTGAAPPASAAVGNRVQASGTVIEFIPAADPGQLPLTELGGTVTVTLLTIGNPLPAPVTLSTALPAPGGALDQLERLEAMRVTAPAFTVVAPTGGSTNEPNATGTTNGIFNVVVEGTPRPFREPGIQAPDAPPAGTIPPIPQWDFNPELLTVVSRAIGGTAIDVAAGARIENLVGPLDYGFRRYTIAPDPAVAPTITPAAAPSPARLPTSDEFTVASYNMERFFDTANDPATGEPVLTPVAFANRLNKASLAIRNFLNAPDILGVVEMENLSTLEAVAGKISDDAVAAGQPDPQYVAYLQEGNDVGGIDVGFLVKSAEVAAGIDRVQVLEVTQLGLGETWTEPGGGTALLNDRPPLRLDAVVRYADGREFPITAIVVHQRSLNGAEEADANGERVRAKRQRQAEYLAEQIDALQADDPERRITVLGDFNAFEFNDGLTDAMNVVTGTPTPDNETAVAGDGVDLVDPDLLNLYLEEPADQRYSFVFDGNAQSLDHVLINQALGVAVAEFDLDHARINADFPEINRNDADSALRLSDHDPVVAYFAAASADLAVTITPSPLVVHPADTITYRTRLTNLGPDPARYPAIGFATNFYSSLTITPPPGWTCEQPDFTDTGMIFACTGQALASGETVEVVFSEQVIGYSPGTRTVVATARSDTADPQSGNNTSVGNVIVRPWSDVYSEVYAGFPTIVKGESGRYVFTIGARISNAENPTFRIRIGVPVLSVDFQPPPGWACEIMRRAQFEVSCSLPGGTLEGDGLPIAAVAVIRTNTRLVPPVINMDIAASSDTTDPILTNNSDSFRVRVVRGE